MPSTADRRTHKWRDVVELVAVGADVSQVANATIRAADSAFSFVNNDSGANQAVGLMTQLGLAAEEKNPLKHLRSQGSDIPDNTSLPGVAAAITQAVEMLRKLLEGEIKKRAKEMREANARGEHLGLTEDEVAFYDALEVNDSAVKVLGDATLRGLARAVGRDGEEKRHHRRDAARERSRPDARDHQTHPSQVRIPVRQTDPRHGAGPRTGGSALRELERRERKNGSNLP